MSAPRKRFWRSSAARRMGGAYSATPRSTKPDWLRDKKINVLLVTALEPSADFPGVPAVIDLVSKEDDRQLLALMAGPSALGRPFPAPPRRPPRKTPPLLPPFDPPTTHPYIPPPPAPTLP